MAALKTPNCKKVPIYINCQVENLGSMALRIVERFTGQKLDVEPEMAILGQRWETVARRVEERLKETEHFSLVEVEKIKTTISHLTFPSTKATGVVNDLTDTNTSVAMKALDDEDSIMTLPEESEIQMSPLKRGLPRETGSAKRPLLAQSLDSSRESSPEREVKTTITAFGNSLPSVKALIRKHDGFAKTMESQRGCIEELENSGAKLIQDDYYAADKIKDNVKTAKQRMILKMDRCEKRKDKLEKFDSAKHFMIEHAEQRLSAVQQR